MCTPRRSRLAARATSSVRGLPGSSATWVDHRATRKRSRVELRRVDTRDHRRDRSLTSIAHPTAVVNECGARRVMLQAPARGRLGAHSPARTTRYDPYGTTGPADSY